MGDKRRKSKALTQNSAVFFFNAFLLCLLSCEILHQLTFLDPLMSSDSWHCFGSVSMFVKYPDLFCAQQVFIKSFIRNLCLVSLIFYISSNIFKPELLLLLIT